jgi:hypothetical protein
MGHLTDAAPGGVWTQAQVYRRCFSQLEPTVALHHMLLLLAGAVPLLALVGVCLCLSTPDPFPLEGR